MEKFMILSWVLVFALLVIAFKAKERIEKCKTQNDKKDTIPLAQAKVDLEELFWKYITALHSYQNANSAYRRAREESECIEDLEDDEAVLDAHDIRTNAKNKANKAWRDYAKAKEIYKKAVLDDAIWTPRRD